SRTFYDSLERPFLRVQNLVVRDGDGNPLPVDAAMDVDTPPAYDPAYPEENLRSETVYDAYGRNIGAIDAAGRVSRSYFDTLDRPYLSVQNLVARDALGNLLSASQAIDLPAPPAYDPAYPDENLSRQTIYDMAGRSIAGIDTLGRVSRTYYDGLGRTYFVVRNLAGQAADVETPPPYDPAHPDQNVGSETVYDVSGRTIATIDSLGRITRTYYDALGRVDSVVQNLVGQAIVVDTPPAYDPQYSDRNLRTQYIYDLSGSRVEVRAPNGVVTHYESDDLGRLAAVVENYRPGFASNPETNVRTEYTYDVSGNRTEILDANSHSTHFAYDGLGRLIAETDALGHTWSYRYDERGRTAGQTDANGFTTSYVYDSLGRLVETDYPDPDADVEFSYNLLGWRMVMTDGVGVTSWQYDSLGRILEVTDPFTGTVAYTYDGAGNRLTLQVNGQPAVQYIYDGLDRLSEVIDSSRVTRYTYDAAGQLLAVDLPNGVRSSYAYDGAGRLLSLTHNLGAESLSSFQYTYDAAGNRVQAIELLGQPESGQIVSVRDTDGLPQAGKRVYVYNGSAYTGWSEVTGEDGLARFDLPEGSYRFRADKNGTQFWSGSENHCTVPGCGSAAITVSKVITVTVRNTAGEPHAGLPVYAYDGGTYTGYSKTTGANGEAVFTLPSGSYRFRSDDNGTQFWSGPENHCDAPGCESAVITVSIPLTITVVDTRGTAQSGLAVYVYDANTYTGFSKTTGAGGQAVFTLPSGSYRFRADKNGT
ncbi:hypothetical protein EHM76_02675, partial [bacterium]